jgi:hypothetical protein
MSVLDANLLLAEIASGDDKRFREATTVIAEIQPETDVDPAVFVSALASSNKDVVFWSAIALEHLGERGRAAVPSLLSLLEREQLVFRQSSVKTLAAVAPRDKRAREAVFRSFVDPSPFVRREALQACIRLPELSADQREAIAAMVADPDETVSRWSEIALRNIQLREHKIA